METTATIYTGPVNEAPESVPQFCELCGSPLDDADYVVQRKLTGEGRRIVRFSTYHFDCWNVKPVIREAAQPDANTDTYTVTIHMAGGVIQSIEAPAGIDVIVIDQDEEQQQ